jgi:hypothetical protein
MPESSKKRLKLSRHAHGNKKGPRHTASGLYVKLADDYGSL